MNARLERKLRLLAAVIVGSVIGAICFVLARGFISPAGIEVGVLYGLLLSVAIGGISLFVLEGPMRGWLRGLSFTASLISRSAIYAAIIIPILFFQLGEVLAGIPVDPLHKGFWISIAYSVAFVILANLVIGTVNIIGPRAFLNFITGRYHSPVEEEPLRAVCRHCGIDRTGRAARRRRHSPSARSYLSPADACGRGLSRRGPRLCRRRGDRDLAGTRRRDRLPSAALLSGDAATSSRAHRANSSANSARCRGFAAACISGRSSSAKSATSSAPSSSTATS